MDFGEEYFWVVMLIFYLVFQVLGARKKKQKHQRRQQPGPHQETASKEPRQGSELDEALSEIRRALGYPDAQREEPETVTPPAQTAGSPPTTADSSRQTARSSRQTAGSARQTASSARQTASSARQTASASRQTASPPAERPLEPRSVRDIPSRIPPPVRREPTKPPRVDRRTAAPGGSIYAADTSSSALGREDLFEKFDKKRTPPAPLADRKSPITAVASQEIASPSRLPNLVKRLQTPSTAREAVLMKEILDPPRAMRRRR